MSFWHLSIVPASGNGATNAGSKVTDMGAVTPESCSYGVDFADAQWLAPGSGAGRRVELAMHGELIALRDSARPEGPYLIFDADEWRAFLAGVDNGEFDVAELFGTTKPPKKTELLEAN